MVLVFVILIGNYYTIDPVNLPEWAERIREKCGAAKLNPNRLYAARSVMDAGLSCCGFASYLGLLF